MKKYILLSFVFSLMFTYNVYANNGDIVGEYFATDIVTNIDNYPINSYNIGGETCIIAEDLPDYGFDVNWDENLRTISVNTKALSEIRANTSISKTQEKIGTPIGKIYETDIVATINGYNAKSYNIGGKTALVVENIAANLNQDIVYNATYMLYDWNDVSRTLSIFCTRPNDTIKTDYGDFKVSNKLNNIISFHNTSLKITDENDKLCDSWIDALLSGEDEYFDILNCKDLSKMNISLDENTLSIDYPLDTSIPKFYYDNQSMVIANHITAYPIDLKLVVCGEEIEYDKPIAYERNGKILVSKNAINSAFEYNVFEYEYQLPAECTVKVDKVIPSQTILYINYIPINSFETANGTIYISVNDLKRFNYTVLNEGNNITVVSPKKHLENPFESDINIPETYWYGTIDDSTYLYDIYNGIYNLTIDGKMVNNVYIDSTLTNKTPCISINAFSKAIGSTITIGDGRVYIKTK